MSWCGGFLANSAGETRVTAALRADARRVASDFGHYVDFDIAASHDDVASTTPHRLISLVCEHFSRRHVLRQARHKRAED